MRLAYLMLVIFVLTTGVAFAQSDKEDNSWGSVAITVDQLKNLQTIRLLIDGNAVHFVLPEHWEPELKGIDPEKGTPLEGAEFCTMVTRPPFTEEETETEFVCELTVYRHSLLEGLSEGATQAEAGEYEAALFAEFINRQIKDYIKMGFSVDTEAKDIMPKEFGIATEKSDLWTRPQKQYFVPIVYTNRKNGAKLYTFSSAVGHEPFVMKFLVSKEQDENYRGLIFVMINNCWAMTLEDLGELVNE